MVKIISFRDYNEIQYLLSFDHLERVFNGFADWTLLSSNLTKISCKGVEFVS